MVLLQVCMAADEGLGTLLPQQPPAVCLPLLKANLPGQGTVNSPACQPTPLIHVSHPQHHIALPSVHTPAADCLSSPAQSNGAGDMCFGGRPLPKESEYYCNVCLCVPCGYHSLQVTTHTTHEACRLLCLNACSKHKHT